MSQIIGSKSPVISLSNSKINRIECSSIKRSSYTNAFKRMAIIHFDMTKSKNKTSGNLKISTSFSSTSWVKDREKIFEPTQKLKHRRVITKATQKQALFKSNEERVHQWFLDLRAQNIKVILI